MGCNLLSFQPEEGPPTNRHKQAITQLLSGFHPQTISFCVGCFLPRIRLPSQKRVHWCPFWLVWLKNRGRFLVYLAVQSSTRESIYFQPKGTPMKKVPFPPFQRFSEAPTGQPSEALRVAPERPGSPGAWPSFPRCSRCTRTSWRSPPRSSRRTWGATPPTGRPPRSGIPGLRDSRDGEARSGGEPRG